MIELTNLTAGYGGVQKVHIDRFALKPSEIVSIIGNNGSGKSTLLTDNLNIEGMYLLTRKKCLDFPLKSVQG